MPGPGAKTRTEATVLRDIDALRLRAAGHTFKQVAVAVGFANKGNAKKAVDRLLNEVRFDAVDEYRQLMLAELEAVKARVLEIFYADHVHVNDGQVVRENGVPVLDHGPNLAAAREFRQLTERIAKLIGADAPTKQQIHVLTEDVVDAALREAAEEHARLTAADPQRSTS